MMYANKRILYMIYKKIYMYANIFLPQIKHYIII